MLGQNTRRIPALNTRLALVRYARPLYTVPGSIEAGMSRPGSSATRRMQSLLIQVSKSC